MSRAEERLFTGKEVDAGRQSQTDHSVAITLRVMSAARPAAFQPGAIFSVRKPGRFLVRHLSLP
jgi:hypothetical protein